jgi:hypothetical protein
MIFKKIKIDIPIEQVMGFPTKVLSKKSNNSLNPSDPHF